MPRLGEHRKQISDEELVRSYAEIWLSTVTPPTRLQCEAFDPPLYYSTLRRRNFLLPTIRRCALVYLQQRGRAEGVSTIPPRRGRAVKD